MTSRQRIPGVTSEAERAILALLDERDNRLNKIIKTPVEQALITSNFAAIEEQNLFLAPIAATGLVGVLPQSTPRNRAAIIRFTLKNANPVRLVCINGLVNGENQAVVRQIGTFYAISDGGAGWYLSDGATSPSIATAPPRTWFGNIGTAAGPPSFIGGSGMGSMIRYTANVTDSTATGTINNYPVNLNTTGIYFSVPSAAADINLGGFTGTENGQEILLKNSPSTVVNIRLLHQSGGAVANRFDNPGSLDYVIGPGESVRVRKAFNFHQVIGSNGGIKDVTLDPGENGLLDISGLNKGGVLSLTLTADSSISGFGGIANDSLDFYINFRTGTGFVLTLVSEDTGITASNRIRCPSGQNYQMKQHDSIPVVYNNTRFRAIGRDRAWNEEKAFTATGTNNVVTHTLMNETFNQFNVTCSSAAIFNGARAPTGPWNYFLRNSASSTQNITVAHENGAAAVSQRYACPGNTGYVLKPGDSADVRYNFSRHIIMGRYPS